MAIWKNWEIKDIIPKSRDLDDVIDVVIIDWKPNIFNAKDLTGNQCFEIQKSVIDILGIDEPINYQEKYEKLNLLLSNNYNWSIIQDIINNKVWKEAIEEEFKKIFGDLIYIDSDITKKLDELEEERIKVINWESNDLYLYFLYDLLKSNMTLKIK